MIPMAKALWLGLERSNMFIEFFSSGLEGDDWLQTPPGFANSPIWHVGHLAYHRGLFLEQLTGKRTYDDSWKPLFDIGCDPVDPRKYPDIETCREFLKARLEDFKSYFEKVTVEELESPLDPPTKFFPTKAALLVHFTHHEAHHTGVLSAIRRSLGKEKLI